MSRAIEKTTATLLAIAMTTMAVAGCGKDTPFFEEVDPQTIPVVQGKYIEERLGEVGSRNSNLTLRQDGTVDIIGVFKENVPTLSALEVFHKTIVDGNVVTEQDTSWFDDVVALSTFGEEEITAQIAMVEETIYLVVSQKEKPFLFVVEKGAVKEIKLDASTIPPSQKADADSLGSAVQKDSYYELLTVNQDHVVLGFGSQVYVFDYEGALVGKDGGTNDETMFFGNGYFLLEDQLAFAGEDVIFQWNLPDLTEAEEIPLGIGGYLFADGEGSVYQINDGLYDNAGYTDTGVMEINKHILSSSTREKLLEGKGYQFGLMESNFVFNMLVDKQDNIFLMMMDENGECLLYRYVFDPSISIEMTEVLELFSLEPSSLLNQAIVVFGQQYPHVKVNHTIASEQQEGRDVEEIRKQLNTEILAGKGPDLLLLDGLPIDNMMDKGFLQGLSEKVDIDSLFPNMATTYEKDGEIYALPTQTKTVMMGGRAEHLTPNTTLDALLERMEQEIGGVLPPYQFISKEKVTYGGNIGGNHMVMEEGGPSPLKPDAPYFSFFSQEAVFESLYPSFAYAMWVDHQLQPDVLKDFLTQTNRIVVHNDILRGEEEDQIHNMPTFWGHNGMEINNSTHWFGLGEIKLYCDNLYTPADHARLMYDGPDTKVEGVVTPFPGYQDKGVFQPEEIIGVLDGANEVAFDFVNTMISAEVQKTNSFPTNKQAFSAVLESGEERALQILTNGEEMVTMTTDLVEIMGTLVPSDVDQTLAEVVRDGSYAFYSGKQSLDETIASIEKETERYLSEK